MTFIKSTHSAFSTSRLERAGSSERLAELREEKGEGDGEAVKFRHQDTQIHRAFRRAEAEDAEKSAGRVSELKARLRDGTYKPDIRVVAERMLVDLGKGGA